LVNPLLAAGGGIDDGLVAYAEDGLVLLFEVVRDVFDVGEFAVEILELVEHVLAPEAFGFQIADELAVKHDEVTGQVALHVEVFVVWLDTWGGAHDVGDGGGGCNG